MNSFREALLQSVLECPSAPFREGHVISAIVREFKAAKVPHFIDPVGNIVVGASSRAEYRKRIGQLSREPLRLFIAHLDHPGFHGLKWISPTELEFKWHGGSPTQHLEGAHVWLATRGTWRGEGTLRSSRLLPGGRALESGVIRLSVAPNSPETKDPREIFGGFAFRKPFWREGELLYTKAADDLVGSFAIASLALDLAEAGKWRGNPPFLGLLTRAEEVGFIGAIGHFELGWLKGAKRPILCVSLETSRALPGAEIGKGPVVRLGDKYTVFDAGALRIFSDLAQGALPDRHQRRVMDGGTCEATAATVFGYPCVGISVPLGNYHNQSFEGGPDSRGSLGPAPEFVHREDIVGLLKLCHALMTPKLPWSAPWKNKLTDFRKAYAGCQPLLKSGP